MGVMPFLATCELFYCMILLFLFEWRIKFSLSGSVHDVIISRNGTNGPESKTTRMLRPVSQVAARGRSLPYSMHLVDLLPSFVTRQSNIVEQQK